LSHADPPGCSKADSFHRGDLYALTVCSMTSITTPPTASAPATVTGPNRWASIQLWVANPTMAAGKKAVPRLNQICRLLGSEETAGAEPEAPSEIDDD